jgi:hypothetical protein
MAVSLAPEDYARGFDTRVAEVVPRLAAAVPAFALRLEDAGVDPRELLDVEALSRVPVLASGLRFNAQVVAVDSVDPAVPLLVDARAWD